MDKDMGDAVQARLAVMGHKEVWTTKSELQELDTFQIIEVGPDHPERLSLQAFIADNFFKTYQADVKHFSETLLGCKDAQGHWVAALGYSGLAHRRAFLEQYLDVPIEQEIASLQKQTVARTQIVEVGNLAALHPGAGRALIIQMTRHLHRSGYQWVVFTATRHLFNSFKRLKLKPVSLGLADPKRLADGGRAWGSYYDTEPEVMFGDIAHGYAELAE